jgi:predicted amidohydrolase
MRIGCLQFSPVLGDVDNNLNRADAVLSRANPKDLDLLVLPELAFSGEFVLQRYLFLALLSCSSMCYQNTIYRLCGMMRVVDRI